MLGNRHVLAQMLQVGCTNLTLKLSATSADVLGVVQGNAQAWGTQFNQGGAFCKLDHESFSILLYAGQDLFLSLVWCDLQE